MIRGLHFILLMSFADSKACQVSCQSSLTEAVMPLMGLEQGTTIIHHNTLAIVPKWYTSKGLVWL